MEDEVKELRERIEKLEEAIAGIVHGGYNIGDRFKQIESNQNNFIKKNELSKEMEDQLSRVLRAKGF